MEELEKVIEFQDKVIIEYQGRVEEVEGKDVGLYEYKKYGLISPISVFFSS